LYELNIVFVDFLSDMYLSFCFFTFIFCFLIFFYTGITQPLRCSSVGDPHITPYTLPGARNDLYSPGSQQPGTYTLSKTGKRLECGWGMEEGERKCRRGKKDRELRK
jgi:hypothetical protein